VKSFVLYTLARAALFAGVYGILWLFVGRSVSWNAVNALYTALIAMVISSLLAFATLRGLREKVALQLANRVQRSKSNIDTRASAEDD
jgi:uncharacterized membrane protein YdjX (TVP38/TMEM64 family)